jgi:hypothetical protein
MKNIASSIATMGFKKKGIIKVLLPTDAQENCF